MKNRSSEGATGLAPALIGRADIDAVLGFELSDEQWQAVCAPLAPTVIVAGAGTGKTTVMAARVLWLVATGAVTPAGVLGLTFTNKAAAELSERITRLLARWADAMQVDLGAMAQPTVATYHSFAGQLLRDQGLRAGVEPGVRHLDEAAVLQLAYRIAASLPAPQLDPGALTTPTRLAAQLIRLDGELAEQVITTQQLRDFDAELAQRITAMPKVPAAAKQMLVVAEVRGLLADLVDELRAAKAQRGLDFADQMRLAAELVTGEAGAVVAAQLRASYQVVLLDEYQDTSIAQRIILSGLFAGHPVTAVGDPLQAIYGWRSASVANIDAFQAHFGAAGIPDQGPRVLSLNRRSGSAILDAANQVAAQLRIAHPQVAPLRPPRPRAAEIRTALLETYLDERNWVADQVASLVAGGRAPAEVGVLTRVGADLVPLAQALAARGVPASVSGRHALLANPYVAEVVRTLRVLADPAANSAITGLLAGPRWRFGAADLAALGARARELAGGPTSSQDPWLLAAVHSPGTGSGLSPDALERLGALRAELTMLTQSVDRGLVGLCHSVIDASGARMEAELAAARSGGAGGWGVAELDQFLELVAGFADADGRTSLGAFVAWLELAERAEQPPQLTSDVAPGCVQLMTVHRAKGLEWPVVVLAALSARRFPASQASPRWPTRADTVPTELRDDRRVLPRLSDYSRADLEQYRRDCQVHDRSGEDRLAYVAISRARDVVIASGHWWGPGARMRGPSPYLLALHAHHTAAAHATEWPWEPEPEPDADGRAPTNPLLAAAVEYPWPLPAPTAPPGAQTASSATEAAVELAALDEDIEVLLAALAGSADPVVGGSGGVPASLSTSELLAALADPARAAADLARPMPRPHNWAADLGTRFHEWVAARLGQQLLIADDELPGAADHPAPDSALAALQQAFERLEYARAVPAALEEPFVVQIGPVLVRGRIDAVFPRPGPGPRWEVVDWKTTGSQQVDPIQLAVYRIAWAQLREVPVSEVSAAFVHVPTGMVVRPELPDEAELAAMLAAGAPMR